MGVEHGKRTRATTRRGLPHRDAVIHAEFTRLVRLLRAYGPLPRETLARLDRPRGRDVSFRQALRAGVDAGEIRELGLGFYEAADRGAL